MGVKSLHWGIAIAALPPLIGLGYWVEQAEFSYIALAYAWLFILYYQAYQNSRSDTQVYFFLYWAIAYRLILLFAFPTLSDDIYRFIWDGRLWIQGANPFDHLPTYYLDPANTLPGLDAQLYEQLNSPNYFTIYPPVCQAIFATACWIFPNSIYGSAILMKLAMFLSEVGSIWLLLRLLIHWQIPLRRSLLYALNPLILIEIMGNLHFEGGMIFFLLLAVWYLVKGKHLHSAIAFALSIAAKLLPLLFLPLLIKRLGWKKSILYYSIVGASLLILFAPLLSWSFIDNFSNSLDLYFRKFEFNASLYYLIRWIGFQIKGYNTIASIGPALALTATIAILITYWREKEPTLQGIMPAMLWAICLYLLSTTTVHPWYTSLPIVLCLFTPYRFPLLWSALIVLTYRNYSFETYQESWWLVGLEYSLTIAFAVWEIGRRFKR